MSHVDLNARILRQVEYYFGDINLSKDIFLKNTLSENDGWLPFDILLKFKRLSELTTDINVIKCALGNSSLVELGPVGIRRSPSNPPPENFADAISLNSEKTVYVKGLPLDITIDAFISWVERCAGPTDSVFLKRRMNKKLKGSAYATFKNIEDAENFLQSTDAATYNDKSLIRMSYNTYIEGKKEERKTRKNEQNIKKAAGDGQNDADVISRMTPGSILELIGYPKSAEPEEIDKTPNEEKPEETPENADATKQEVAAEASNEISDTVKDNGIPKSESSRDVGMHLIGDLKAWLNEKLSSSIPIAWIDVNPELKKFMVRFKEPNSAVSALEKLKHMFDDGKIVYKNAELSGRVLTGDEEFNFWKSLFAVLQAKKRPYNNSGRGRFNHKRRRFN